MEEVNTEFNWRNLLTISSNNLDNAKLAVETIKLTL